METSCWSDERLPPLLSRSDEQNNHEEPLAVVDSLLAPASRFTPS